MDRVGVRRGPGRTPSGAWIPQGTGSSAQKPDGESAAYDSRIQAGMDKRVGEAEAGLKSKARRRALGRMS
jgi:hypothetical protein